MAKLYLDHNATTFLRKEVREAMYEVSDIPLNGSSIHYFGQVAKKLLHTAKNKIAAACRATEEYQVLILSGGTEANNMVIRGFPGRIILTTRAEHISILANLDYVEHALIELDSEGKIILEHYKELLNKYRGNAVVAIAYGNNESGVIQDIKMLVELAHQYNCLFYTDAVQAFGKVPFSVAELKADLLTISAHKIGGPGGIAALIYRRSINIEPLIKGGAQEFRLRAGTENIIALHGFGIAAELVSKEVIEYKEHTQNLRNFLEARLRLISPSIIIVGEKSERLPNTSCLTMPHVNNMTQLIKFDLANIAISAGAACSSGKVSVSHVLKAMGIQEEIASTAIRVSLGKDNTKKQIEIFVEEWEKIYRQSYIAPTLLYKKNNRGNKVYG